MDRLTTDCPKTNTEALLNYAYVKDGRVRLRYADGEDDRDLCEYVAHLSSRCGCDATPESVMEGICMECDCEMAVLYAVAIQAAELRARLAKYEDAEEQGRLLVMPCKEGTPVYRTSHRLNGNHEIMKTWFSLTYIRPGDFGKTVFLTREEAEAALEGDEHG